MTRLSCKYRPQKLTFLPTQHLKIGHMLSSQPVLVFALGYSPLSALSISIQSVLTVRWEEIRNLFL